MHFELFHLGPLTVYTYGFLIAVGILAAFFVADRRGKTMGMDTSRLEAMTLTVCIAGFACSKLLYILTRLPDIIADPGILMNLEDGWVVYGGIIGGLLGGLWYCRRHQMNFMAWFDLLIPEVALAQDLAVWAASLPAAAMGWKSLGHCVSGKGTGTGRYSAVSQPADFFRL